MLSFVVLSVLLAAFADAQIPVFGSCPNVTAVHNFDVKGYLGKWYEIERYFSVNELGGKCITADYELRDDGAVSVVNQQINELTGLPSSIDGYAKLATDSGDAKLSVTFPSLPVKFDAPYWVIDTDYDNYSVVWSCVDLGLLSARSSWILTRARNPSAEILQKAYAALDKQNISRDYLVQTNQQNCPEE